MESEVSEVEKTKNIALGKLEEELSQFKEWVEKMKESTKKIENGYPGSYERSIIEWYQFVMFLNLYNNYIVLDD